MSYDLRVAVKIEGCEQYADIATPEFDNPTYNLRDMFVACMDWDYSQGEYYPCSEYIKKIEHGIHELHNNEKAYEKYNSPNGWGKTVDALIALKSWRKCICEQAEEIPIDCLYMRW